MATPSSDTLCVLCNEDISGVPQEEIVTLGKKGSATVNQNSEERGSEVRPQELQRVHKECRKRWGVKYYIQAAKSKEQIDTPSPCKLRSQNKKFEISQDCVFCCQPAQCDGRRGGYDVFPVITNEPQDSHLKSVVLRIGGLHTEMSYLGCIGHRGSVYFHADFRFRWIYQAARRVVLEIGLVISQGAQTICLKFEGLVWKYYELCI